MVLEGTLGLTGLCPNPNSLPFKIPVNSCVIWLLIKIQLEYNCSWPSVKPSFLSQLTVAVSNSCSYLLCNLAGLLFKNDFVPSQEWLTLEAQPVPVQMRGGIGRLKWCL